LIGREPLLSDGFTLFEHLYTPDTLPISPPIDYSHELGRFESSENLHQQRIAI
jgi:hypothetical protein